jgi:predicted GH43/DUF377 family glycosyl hydrolase
MIHELKLDHAPIESSPHFVCRIDPEDLVPAARCYNPSICLAGDQVVMAYRAESYSAVSRIGMAYFDKELSVSRSAEVPLPNDEGDVHWEDPRLAWIGGRLHLMAAYIRLRVPVVCQQRLFVLDVDSLKILEEIPLPFGKMGAGVIEKNWTPFELPDGVPGFVYQQRPGRIIIEPLTKAGHESPSVPIAPTGSTLSGRSGPISIEKEGFLEFVGGWVRLPAPGRSGRYWFGAQILSPKAPYAVRWYTPKPLMWGSEASPTIHSPRPNAGHPCCVFPAGSFVDGDDVVVSVGVNDSYCCLLRYEIDELLSGMILVP